MKKIDFNKMIKNKKEFSQKLVKDLKAKYGAMTKEQFEIWLNT